MFVGSDLVSVSVNSAGCVLLVGIGEQEDRDLGTLYEPYKMGKASCRTLRESPDKNFVLS